MDLEINIIAKTWELLLASVSLLIYWSKIYCKSTCQTCRIFQEGKLLFLIQNFRELYSEVLTARVRREGRRGLILSALKKESQQVNLFNFRLFLCSGNSQTISRASVNLRFFEFQHACPAAFLSERQKRRQNKTLDLSFSWIMTNRSLRLTSRSSGGMKAIGYIVRLLPFNALCYIFRADSEILHLVSQKY